MSERSTPETDALAEKLIPIAEKITEFNAQSIIKQLLTEILTKTTKLERERDEARAEWGKASMDAAQLLNEKTKVIAERDEAREAYDTLATEHVLAVNKLAEERDDARKEFLIANDKMVEAECRVREIASVLERVKRERDEWAAMCGRYKQERDELLKEIKRLRIDAQREAEYHDSMVKELEGLYDKLKS